MLLEYTQEQQDFRVEVSQWFATHVPQQSLPSLDTAEGFAAHREWERTLHSGRWGMVTWPEAYGGRNLDLLQWLIFEEEYYRAKAPTRVNQNGIFLLGPTLMEYGSEEQKQRFLPAMAAGDHIWAQAWSEPGAGSDMAAIRSHAELKGSYYVINGQKTWSTRATYADWCFGLFRTDPTSKRHKGLSFLLVPLNAKGVTVRPIPQLDGLPGFAEIFFDNVEVPVDQLLGEPEQGWQIAMATAGFERGLMLRSPARFEVTAKRLVDLYHSCAPHTELPADIGDAVLECWMGAQAYALQTYRTACHLMQGGKIGSESSLNKVFWSELDQKMHDIAWRILGTKASLKGEASQASAQGQWLDGFLFSRAGPIYAGTNEIQRNIIAERMLGLPR